MPAPERRPLLEPWDDDDAPGPVLGVVRIGHKSRVVLAVALLGARQCVHVQRQLWSEERQSWESRGGLVSLEIGETLDDFVAALERGRERGEPEPDARRYKR